MPTEQRVTKNQGTEEKLAKLAEENEKLQKKVAEVDNPPPSLLNQMDTANRSLNKLISEFRTQALLHKSWSI